MNALALDGVTKRLGTFLLDRVTLAVPRGAITGLVGANGAGKSTLIKLVLGLLGPDAGTVTLLGEPAGARPRARVGFVQETPSLPVNLDLAGLARFVAPFYPTWDPALYQALCRDFAIPPRTGFAALSQGNRMKASLALAMAHRPELLVLDEPTSGLDPLARREFLALLLEVVQDERRAVLFSTHITSDLDRVADHVALLKEGQLVLAGAREELMDAWVLVKGGPELLGAAHGGGCRTDLGVTLLCRAGEVPRGSVAERPRLEDLLYLFGRSPEEVPTCSL